MNKKLNIAETISLHVQHIYGLKFVSNMTTILPSVYHYDWAGDWMISGLYEWSSYHVNVPHPSITVSSESLLHLE
jgi:hypothetical protein